MNYRTKIGHPITFVQWVLQVYSIGIVITGVVVFWITFIHKPEKISDKALISDDAYN